MSPARPEYAGGKAFGDMNSAVMTGAPPDEESLGWGAWFCAEPSNQSTPTARNRLYLCPCLGFLASFPGFLHTQSAHTHQHVFT